ncbi:hypothetical protein HW532_15845 [Kaustia mangrovi]|uniref:Phosphoadenosine phosphosulphate reductase domain-containing protein n=1 Tax=Kaustia mangrovi TaxID=2593653 RepID=A0A7S8C603_9HYPH|nr:hypothetical protein [Kaustia mangrovi]QPC44035.1 hypothetical protein HW532_15845 [Kaustia mangrovi]
MSKVRRGGWSWGPVEGVSLRALSLGGGVQSTALALMTCHGVVGPRPDVMIFSDPGDEASLTMRHLDWLEAEVTRQTNGQMRCIRTSKGERLSDSIRRRARGRNGVRKDGEPNRFVSAPFFTANGGQGRRQCTREFKVEPITKVQRELLGFKPRQRIPPRSCEIWIGFSTDEVVRAGPSFERWTVHRFPLLEERMSRWDCEQWLRRHGYPVPPKSACVFCPYRSNAEWRWLKEHDPEAWNEAVEIDRLIRNTPGMKHAEYVHRSCVPLDEVDLSTAEDRGQGNMLEICEGGCGL